MTFHEASSLSVLPAPRCRFARLCPPVHDCYKESATRAERPAFRARVAAKTPGESVAATATRTVGAKLGSGAVTAIGLRRDRLALD